MKKIDEIFYNEISDVLRRARNYANKAVNFAVVIANWNIGR